MRQACVGAVHSVLCKLYESPVIGSIVTALRRPKQCAILWVRTVWLACPSGFIKGSNTPILTGLLRLSKTTLSQLFPHMKIYITMGEDNDVLFCFSQRNKLISCTLRADFCFTVRLKFTGYAHSPQRSAKINPGPCIQLERQLIPGDVQFPKLRRLQ